MPSVGTSEMYFLVGRHISFSLYMPIAFKLYTCVSIQNTNRYEVLSDSHKYFTSVSHICSSISMTPQVFFFAVILVFANAYKVSTTIHKHFTTGNHICYSHLWTHKYSLFSTHFSSLFMQITFVNINMYVDMYVYICMWIQKYIDISIHTYIHACLPTSIHTYRLMYFSLHTCIFYTDSCMSGYII